MLPGPALYHFSHVPSLPSYFLRTRQTVPFILPSTHFLEYWELLFPLGCSTWKPVLGIPWRLPWDQCTFRCQHTGTQYQKVLLLNPFFSGVGFQLSWNEDDGESLAFPAQEGECILCNFPVVTSSHVSYKILIAAWQDGALIKILLNMSLCLRANLLYSFLKVFAECKCCRLMQSNQKFPRQDMQVQ